MESGLSKSTEKRTQHVIALDKIYDLEDSLDSLKANQLKRENNKFTAVVIAFLVTIYFTWIEVIPMINFLFVSQKNSDILRNHLEFPFNRTTNDAFISDQFSIESDIIEDLDLMMFTWSINDRSPRFFVKESSEMQNVTYGDSGKVYSLLNMTWASAATPMYFTPAEFDGKYFISGDNIALSPAMFAVMRQMEKDPEKQIRVMSIGGTNPKVDRID